MTPVEEYIRQRAPLFGVDPDIAVQVAMSEGGVTDPVRQSDVMRGGKRETSYGPFQLLIGGGLGDKALKAGIDPRDPAQWQKGVDFALREAAMNGWDPWYGAAKVGITGKEGISAMDTLPGISAPAIPGTTITSTPPAATPETPAAPTPGKLDWAGALAALGSATGKGGGGGAAWQPASTDITPSSIGSTIGAGAGAQAAAQLMAQLMAEKRSRYGTTLNKRP